MISPMFPRLGHGDTGVGNTETIYAVTSNFRKSKSLTQGISEIL